MRTSCTYRADIFIQVDSIWCSQINVHLLHLLYSVLAACTQHTYISCFVHDSFKFIAWVQGVYSPKTGCILLCFLMLCGNMFPDIVHVHIVVLYMICFTLQCGYRVCTVKRKGELLCSFYIMWKYVSFPNCTAYLPSCTVILVTALAYANTASSAVLLANYTLLFGKFMHLWIHVLIYGLI